MIPGVKSGAGHDDRAGGNRCDSREVSRRGASCRSHRRGLQQPSAAHADDGRASYLQHSLDPFPSGGHACDAVTDRGEGRAGVAQAADFDGRETREEWKAVEHPAIDPEGSVLQLWTRKFRQRDEGKPESPLALAAQSAREGVDLFFS